MSGNNNKNNKFQTKLKIYFFARERNVLLNDALNTFYLRLYGVIYFTRLTSGIISNHNLQLAISSNTKRSLVVNKLCVWSYLDFPSDQAAHQVLDLPWVLGYQEVLASQRLPLIPSSQAVQVNQSFLKKHRLIGGYYYYYYYY